MEIIKTLINEMADSGEMDALVRDTVKESVEAGIKKAFGGYDFTRKIEAAFEEQIHPDCINLSAYNQLIAKALEKAVKTVDNEAIQQKLIDQVNEIINPGKKEYSVDEIFNGFLQQCDIDSDLINAYHNDYADLDDLGVTYEVDDSCTLDGYYSIYMDSSKDTNKLSCDYQISVNSRGEIYNLKIDGHDLKKGLPIRVYGTLDSMLITAFLNKAKIVRN